MYYVIEQSYEGPNPDQHPDDHTILVQTRAGLGNMSHQPILSGWLGTTNDWCEYAHGAYETLDDAKAKIDYLTGENHRIDDLDLQDRMEGVVYRVRVGRLEPWNAAGSQDWCYESMLAQLGGDASDHDIEDWAEECAECAEQEGALLDIAAVVRMATQYRDEKKAAAMEDEDDDPDNRHYAAGYPDQSPPRQGWRNICSCKTKSDRCAFSPTVLGYVSGASDTPASGSPAPRMRFFCALSGFHAGSATNKRRGIPEYVRRLVAV